MEKVYTLVFKCLEGSSEHEKLKIFGRKEKLNEYATEFIQNKFNEGWHADSEKQGEYVLNDSERYQLVTLEKQVHF